MIKQWLFRLFKINKSNIINKATDTHNYKHVEFTECFYSMYGVITYIEKKGWKRFKFGHEDSFYLKHNDHPKYVIRLSHLRDNYLHVHVDEVLKSGLRYIASFNGYGEIAINHAITFIKIESDKQ